MGTLKPNKRHRSEFLEVRTLRGMSMQDRCDFSYADLPRFFKVTLWDKDHLCKWEECPFEGRIIKTFEAATLDHIVPRSRGGHTRLLNLQLMHTFCNGQKSDKMPEKYNRFAFRPVQSRISGTAKYYKRKRVA